TFASRAFLISAATLGSEATQVGRELHTAVVRSRTSMTAPFTGISTATAAGTLGVNDVGAGEAVTSTVGADEVAGVGVGAAACGAQLATRSAIGNTRRAIFMTALP